MCVRDWNQPEMDMRVGNVSEKKTLLQLVAQEVKNLKNTVKTVEGERLMNSCEGMRNISN